MSATLAKPVRDARDGTPMSATLDNPVRDTRDGTPMSATLAAYGQVLRQAAAGRTTPIDLRSRTGQTLARMDAAQWFGDPRPGDETVLDACAGATLDVGCGPARLVSALALRGVPALGIDISADAIKHAHSRGAAARLCDVFSDVPDAGWWAHVLLIDGNIGIGGAPVHLLRQCAKLLRANGTLIAEMGAPGSGTWRRRVQLHHEGISTPPFPWAAVAVDDLAPLAVHAGLAVIDRWSTANRWFVRLGPQLRS
jgi:SAM-dependent methyltransferase